MKTILSTLMAVGILAGAASAQSPIYDPFNDPSQALPRSDVSNDDYRQALPRSVSNDDYRAALPFTDEVFPDTTIAKP